MSKIPKAELKAKFAAGKKPVQQDFFDLIDSMVHLDDQVAVDSSVVNTRIGVYDTALKGRQPDGTVNTLGDVFYSFTGYDDARKITDELKWSGIPNKPASINLAWTEQTVSTDETAYNPLGSTGSPGAGAAQRWLLTGVGGLTGSFVLIDLRTDRRWVSTGGETGFYADRVISVRCGIVPKVNL